MAAADLLAGSQPVGTDILWARNDEECATRISFTVGGLGQAANAMLGMYLWRGPLVRARRGSGKLGCRRHQRRSTLLADPVQGGYP